MKMPSANGKIIYLDQTLTSGRGKFANHKCRPNALLSVTSSGAFLFAREVIDPGTEVTYDYGISCDLDDSDGEEDDVPNPCHCGSGDNCKGFY
jgi:SET domain-containing protein